MGNMDGIGTGSIAVGGCGSSYLHLIVVRSIIFLYKNLSCSLWSRKRGAWDFHSLYVKYHF